mmetsp:Transcript_6526/g.15295  ORF Transcript_6526/g.15295 Transcript_6526/m.15295 type:complete len:297 (+) Transcript_6526:457-1347(+)
MPYINPTSTIEESVISERLEAATMTPFGPPTAIAMCSSFSPFADSSARRLAASMSSFASSLGDSIGSISPTAATLCIAMPSSSLVGTTRILVRECTPEMMAGSFTPDAPVFLVVSRTIPSRPSPWHTIARMRSEFSPTPAVNTNASNSPSSLTRNDPMYLRILSTKIFSANAASASPLSAAACTACMLLWPVRPSSPLRLFRSVSTSLGDMPRALIRWVTTPASMSPERVPITRPSSGVSPMVVSMHLPCLMQAMLAPLPRWQMMAFISVRFMLRRSAVAPVTKQKELPWNPYLRM